MSLTYVGSISVATLAIGVSLVMDQLALRIAALQGKLLELQAKIDSITAQLDLIAQVSIPNPLALTAGLQAALAGVAQIAVQFPTATVQIGASLQADIAATLALAVSIQVELDLALALQAQLTAALSGGGIAAWSYSGPVNGLGSALRGELASGMPTGGGATQRVDALVLACSSPADWAKLGVVLKTA